MDNNLTLDTIYTELRHHLKGDTANPYCDIRVEFIYPLSRQEEQVDSLQRFFVCAMFGTAYEGWDLQRQWMHILKTTWITIAAMQKYTRGGE